MTLYNKVLGSLLCGAAGDALGYAVEFQSLASIVRRHGEHGITRYELDGEGLARFSDDTQMSLFTAAALTRHDLLQRTGEESTAAEQFRLAYLDWYATQQGPLSNGSSVKTHSWLACVPGLNVCRAPGNTCLSSLAEVAAGQKAVNHSKGCGGVMRVAPVALWAASAHPDMPQTDVARLAADAAAITHCHPLGYLSAAALAVIIRDLAPLSPDEAVARLPEAVILAGLELALLGLRVPAYDDTADRESLSQLLLHALRLGEDTTIAERDAVARLGEGWVGDEALAIAVMACVRHPRDIEAALVCAVNHSGDSDSTGAIAGNIIGAMLGMEAIPDHFLRQLELRDVLEQVAADLAGSATSPLTSDLLARYAVGKS